MLPLLPGGPPTAQFAFSLQPGESRFLATSGISLPAAVGFALVFTDRPVLAHVLFSSDFGFAGVPSQRPLRDFGVPVLRDAAATLNSGVALADLSGEGCEVTLSLRGLDGAELAAASVRLPPLGHQASFIDEVFPQIDTRNLEGSLTGEAACDFGAMALLLRGNQLATLPVE